MVNIPIDRDISDKVTYWRSDKFQFSVEYKGLVTEINRGDIGYGDMDRMDGIIHAAIGCKRDEEEACKEYRSGIKSGFKKYKKRVEGE